MAHLGRLIRITLIIADPTKGRRRYSNKSNMIWSSVVTTSYTRPWAGGGAIPLDCFRSRRSAYWRPGVGIECRPPASFVGDFLVIGVECLFGGRGMRDGVWPGVLAADRGTADCDFLGVANSRTPEARPGAMEAVHVDAAHSTVSSFTERVVRGGR